MSKLDLHIHTNYSDDGEFTPREIIEQCVENQMELIAVADHNSVRGVAEAMAAAGEMAEAARAKAAETAGGGAAKAVNLKLLSAVELDCVYKGRNFHLLGYDFDHTRAEFAEIEADILRQEKHAAEEKVRLFRQATGIPVNLLEVLVASENGVVPGELIGEILLARPDAGHYEALCPYLPGGEKSDMPNVRFYWDFFSEGKPAYVPIRYLSLPDAAALIHSAGGIAVLAHPGQNLGGDDALLAGIISEKIDGIEAFSSYHSQETAAHYRDLALQNHLLVTCGSDYHGKHKPNIRLGGHGATWTDQKLRAGIEACLGEKRGV